MKIARLLVTGGSGFIGTNAVEFGRAYAGAVCSIDVAPPRNPAHAPYWRRCDLLDRGAVRAVVAGFRPTHVLHLAARTDLRETRDLAGYAANTAGVRHLTEALAESGCDRAVYTSSMLVCRNGYRPRDEFDYCPDTLYGASKVEGERIVRDARPRFPWCIVRPTSIWGPWFGEPYRGFFEAVARGVYRHPGRRPVVKAFGYVGNTVWQLYGLLTAPAQPIDGRVFYLSDYETLSVRQWAELVADALRARPIGSLPVPLFRAAALAGDLLKAAGVSKPPLTSFRLRNMLTSSAFDLSPIRELSGPLPFSVAEGVRATAEWLKSSFATAD
jgi:GlcNAc-P-P-Und epimerase